MRLLRWACYAQGMKFFRAALHATLDARSGIATATTEDEARHRAYACRVMADKYAARGCPGLAALYRERAYTTRSRVWR